MKQLLTIQQGLRSRKDKKGDGGRFSYRSAEDILENVKPLLKETNTTVILSDSIWECERNEGKFFLIATATLWGSEGKIAETQGVAMLDEHTSKSGFKSMSNEQATGSASSYARKYALCGLFAIDDSDQDPDGFKSLMTRIKECKTAEELNSLIPEMHEASEDERKAFNAQAKKLNLVFHKAAMKYVTEQEAKKQQEAKQQPQNKQ